MGNYLPTDSIYVFPSSRRMNKQVSARLISEASLANIVNKLIETDGFVITPEPETGDYVDQGFNPEEPFEFNVHGYYFYVDTAQNIIDSFAGTDPQKIYANIYLDKTTDPNYVELAGQDDYINETGYEQDVLYYKGLTFSDTDLTAEGSEPQADYSLKLFEKEQLPSSGTYGWVVPIESRLKFLYTFALGVDGGEILPLQNGT